LERYLAMNMRENIFIAVKLFAKDERGISALEYGLLAAGIALVVFSAASGIGTQLSTLFGNVASDLSDSAT